ncbi:MAG: helix-turn-helix domain-containing protein [Acidobacteria bacterium]|nr:helix-turn-helix domain-containing protein [Acidobacteriota bacterium]
MSNRTIASWPRLLDLKTAAAYLSIGARTIEDWIRDGLLEPVPMPGSTIKDKSGKVICTAKSRRICKILIDREDLDRLIEERRAS